MESKEENEEEDKGKDKGKEKDKETSTPIFSIINERKFLENCYTEEWITSRMSEEERKEKILDYMICKVCNQIANNAVEMICTEHESEDEPLMIGEQCLLTHFQKTKNNIDNDNADAKTSQICPINHHKSCQYIKSRVVRKQIDKLLVVCPLQYQFQKHCQQAQIHTTTLETGIEPEIEMEESMNGASEDMEVDTYECTYQGTIKEIKAHLSECIQRPFPCEFQKFGCNIILYKYTLQAHMQSEMARHLQLVAKQAEKQMKEREQGNNHINELQSKILRLQKENEIKSQEIEALKIAHQNELRQKDHEIERLRVRKNRKKSDKRNQSSPLLPPSSLRPEIPEEKSERTPCVCQEMVKKLKNNKTLKNGVHYMLVEEDNRTIKLKNDKWTKYEHGMYLLGENITVTVDCKASNEKNGNREEEREEEDDTDVEDNLAHLKLKVGHLWIKHPSSKIHCDAMGHRSGSERDNSIDYSVNRRDKGIDRSYREETLLKGLHCGSGGRGNGGRGGGIINLRVKGHMVNEGMLTCNGGSGEGGGGGGSILIKFTNANAKSYKYKHIFGIIQCKGGPNETSKSNGESGRIAIYGIKLSTEDKRHIDPCPFNKKNIAKMSL